MADTLKYLIVLCLFVFVFSKELHTKQTLESKDKDPKGFMNLFNNEDVFTKNERFARHMKTVTESVLDHLIREIKEQYLSENYNPNSPIQRLVKNLSKELKRRDKEKLQKEKEKRKNLKKNKSKMTNRNYKLKLTTAKTTTL